MIELLLLALALSMDAFAVSLGLGAKHTLKPVKLAVLAALYFGVFQGLMPLIGYFGGREILDFASGYTRWIAFGLLVLIGAKMIHESISDAVDEEVKCITQKLLFMLGVATSIDAMAAGFTLGLIDVSPLLSCLIIGLTTALVSFVGVFVGARSGAALESKAEILGGTVLILIGFKMLLF